jgi:hypothetical protein
MKIRPVGAELFHADGQTDRRTDMTKLMVAFRNFANAPTKKEVSNYLQARPFNDLMVIRLRATFLIHKRHLLLFVYFWFNDSQ